MLEPQPTTWRDGVARGFVVLVIATGAFVAFLLWFVSETGWVGAVIPVAWLLGSVYGWDTLRLLRRGKSSAVGLVLTSSTAIVLPVVTYRILDHLT